MASLSVRHDERGILWGLKRMVASTDRSTPADLRQMAGELGTGTRPVNVPSHDDLWEKRTFALLPPHRPCPHHA